MDKVANNYYKSVCFFMNCKNYYVIALSKISYTFSAHVNVCLYNNKIFSSSKKQTQTINFNQLQNFTVTDILLSVVMRSTFYSKCSV